MNILLGLSLIAIGGSIIAFHNQLIERFGDIERAERNNIGTKGMYVLIGCGIIMISVFILFGQGPSNPTSTDSMGFQKSKVK